MVFNVRCFKCGEQAVRLVLGGRSIIHARCHSCDSNLLAEIMELEAEVEAARANTTAPITEAGLLAPPVTAQEPTETEIIPADLC